MSTAITNQATSPSIAIKSIYWGATGLLSAMMLFSAVNYFTNEQMAAGFQHLGFPAFFRIELGLAKILGVIALLAPGFFRIKEWAYAGFTITFISAFLAHLNAGDPTSMTVAPLVALGILVVSYATLRKARA